MKTVVFSGTSEGHALCRFLSRHGVPADAYVATEYGEQVLEPMDGITVHTGRLAVEEMVGEIGKGALVIDATHPYADVVSQNICAACETAGSEYLRLTRPPIERTGVETVPDTAAAVEWLKAHPGRVLLTTGSKELDAYTAIEDYRERIFPRVLPTASVLAKCEALGFPGASVIAMQGPFSHEMNVALLDRVGADILVTKDTGRTGGFAEKLSAACETDVQVLVIARPTEESGRTLEEMKAYLTERLGLSAEQQKSAPPRFPLFINLAGKTVLVAGAGKIASRRIAVLCRFGARVRVVAPEVRGVMDSGAEVEMHVRGWEKSDLSDVFLAVAATDDRTVNHEIAAECAQQGILCSVADSAVESTFFFPAVCEGQGLIAGVVSDGTAHGAVRQAAKRIRTVLEEEHGTD